MEKTVKIFFKGNTILINAENCNFLKKFVGLMFSRRQKAKILLFEFKKAQKIAIHSFFVFYPFLAIWTDKDGKIVDLKRVYSFNPYVSPKKKCFNLIEIPINSKNKNILSLFDDN